MGHPEEGKMNPQPSRPTPPKPAGEQAIGTQLYALIRQAIAEIKR
jgi:hypothetical protein